MFPQRRCSLWWRCLTWRVASIPLLHCLPRWLWKKVVGFALLKMAKKNIVKLQRIEKKGLNLASNVVNILLLTGYIIKLYREIKCGLWPYFETRTLHWLSVVLRIEYFLMRLISDLGYLIPEAFLGAYECRRYCIKKHECFCYKSKILELAYFIWPCCKGAKSIAFSILQWPRFEVE